MNKQKALDSIPGAPPSPHPNLEVVAQAQRRRFTAEYKPVLLPKPIRPKGSAESALSSAARASTPRS